MLTHLFVFCEDLYVYVLTGDCQSQRPLNDYEINTSQICKRQLYVQPIYLAK